MFRDFQSDIFESYMSCPQTDFYVQNDLIRDFM